MTNIMHDDYHGFGKLGEGYGGFNKIDKKIVTSTKGKVVKTLDEGYRNKEEGYRNPVEWV